MVGTVASNGQTIQIRLDHIAGIINDFGRNMGTHKRQIIAYGQLFVQQLAADELLAHGGHQLGTRPQDFGGVGHLPQRCRIIETKNQPQKLDVGWR